MTMRACMRARTIVVALLVLLTVSTAAASAPAATPAPLPPAARVDAPAPAGVRLAACRRSPSIDERTAVAAAWMRPIPGATRLALRMDLQQQVLGARRWTRRTDVPGLGTWTTPSDALLGTRVGDVFKYRQAVGRLVVPAAYRFRVAFRWLDAAGAIASETSLTTSACRQPDLRPDLVIDAVRAESAPVDVGVTRWIVVVRNAGRSAVARVTLAATLPGDAVPGGHLRGAGRLEAGASAAVAVTGPGCAADAAAPLFVVDPSNAVDEADEANNERAAACPATP